MNILTLIKQDCKIRIRRSIIILPLMVAYNLQFVYFNLLPFTRYFFILFQTESYVSFLTTKIGLLYILPLTFLAIFASFDMYKLKNYSYYRTMPVKTKQVLIARLIGFNLEFIFYSTLQYFVSLLLLQIFVTSISWKYPSAHKLIVSYVSISFFFHILIILSFNLLNSIALFFFTFFSLGQFQKLRKLVPYYLFYIFTAVVFVFIYEHFIDMIMFMPFFAIKKAFIDNTNILLYLNSAVMLLGWSVLLCLPLYLNIDSKIDFN
jgi:hypothetical protein